MSMDSDEQAREQALSKHPRLRKVVGLLMRGLAAVVPIVGTTWLLVIIYKVLMGVGDGMLRMLLRGMNVLRGGEDWVSADFAFPGSNFLRFLMPVVLLLLIGGAVASKAGHRLLHWLNHVMQRIPYLGYIYSALIQFVDAIRDLGGDRKFKSVAYVDYPSPGCRMLSFVTGNYHDPQTGKNVTSVFIPTSPNPMTGFVIIVEDELLEHSEMSLEEATKMILSAGLVAPASYVERDVDPVSPSTKQAAGEK